MFESIIVRSHDIGHFIDVFRPFLHLPVTFKACLLEMTAHRGAVLTEKKNETYLSLWASSYLSSYAW